MNNLRRPPAISRAEAPTPEDLRLPVRAITQGEYLVGGRVSPGAPLFCISTVLGSCVAACLYDPESGIGGMNHFMLPESNDNAVNPASYGVNAMELLINALIKAGANKTRLVGKVFGGATMMRGSFNIGERNIEFTNRFLRAEAIRCVSQSMGGDQARRVEFYPHDGRVRQHLLHKPAAQVDRSVPRSNPGNEVEMF